jgi:hypoxanthine-DNA glycosylase
LRLQQYYANPRNQFWSILANIHGQVLSSDYSDRLSFLKNHGISLWDTLRSANRVGSLDGNIKNAVANEFSELFARMSTLHTVVFNGATAEKMFERHVRKQISLVRIPNLRFIRLPSTSPVPGKNVLTFDQKIEKWRIILQS